MAPFLKLFDFLRNQQNMSDLPPAHISGDVVRYEVLFKVAPNSERSIQVILPENQRAHYPQLIIQEPEDRVLTMDDLLVSDTLQNDLLH